MRSAPDTEEALRTARDVVGEPFITAAGDDAAEFSPGEHPGFAGSIAASTGGTSAIARRRAGRIPAGVRSRFECGSPPGRSNRSIAKRHRRGEVRGLGCGPERGRWGRGDGDGDGDGAGETARGTLGDRRRRRRRAKGAWSSPNDAAGSVRRNRCPGRAAGARRRSPGRFEARIAGSSWKLTALVRSGAVLSQNAGELYSVMIIVSVPLQIYLLVKQTDTAARRQGWQGVARVRGDAGGAG